MNYPSPYPHRPKPSTSDAHNPVETFEWLTAAEAACYLRIQTRTLLMWTREGKVKGFSLSGTKRRVWRYRRVDLDGLLLGEERSLTPNSAVRALKKEAL